MACIKLNCRCFQTSSSICQLIHLLTFTFLLLPTLSSCSYMAHARDFMKHNEDSLKGVGLMMRQVMGSKPPRCGQRCKSCGHCEAVQVPIVPMIKKSLQHKNPLPLARIAYSRGDDISNYKPMCWKCKCGDFFFNPW